MKLVPTYKIFVKTEKGLVFQAFTWVGDPNLGIERARKEGPEFGHKVADVWFEQANNISSET